VPAGHTRWIVYRDGWPVAAEDRAGRTELAPAGELRSGTDRPVT